MLRGSRTSRLDLAGNVLEGGFAGDVVVTDRKRSLDRLALTWRQRVDDAVGRDPIPSDLFDGHPHGTGDPFDRRLDVGLGADESEGAGCGSARREGLSAGSLA
jgi:hypothetical protein